MEIKLRQEYGNLDEYVYDENASYKELMPGSLPKGKDYVYTDNELPSPTLDNIFKIMFSTPANKRFACLLFSTILDIDDERHFKDKMRLCQNELSEIWIGGSKVRLDFLGEYDGIYFNLEMNGKNTLARNVDYAGRVYVVNSKERKEDDEESKEKYSQVIQMNINNFRIAGIEEPIQISISTNGKVQRTKIMYIDVYLPLIYKKYTRDGIGNLRYAERIILAMFIGEIDKAEELGKEDEEIMMFIKRLKSLKKNKKVIEESQEVKDRIWVARQNGFENGIEQGIEKGIEQGVEKAQIENATNMLKDGMNPELVQKYTNLPLNKIQNIMMML